MGAQYWCKHMCGIEWYLSSFHGVCINGEMVVHLLWAGDLLLLSDTFHGLQTQLEALGQFIRKKHMPVNDMKVKFMIAVKPEISKLLCNSVDMAEVNGNQYLCNVVSPTRFPGQDPFKTIISSYVIKLE